MPSCIILGRRSGKEIWFCRLVGSGVMGVWDIRIPFLYRLSGFSELGSLSVFFSFSFPWFFLSCFFLLCSPPVCLDGIGGLHFGKGIYLQPLYILYN